jgi:hypothetical protein
VNSRPGEPSKIQFRLACDDADLSRLALDALNAHRAHRFALEGGLPFDEVPARPSGRAFALLVEPGRLEEVLLGLRVEGVSFGPVECGDPAALETCRDLGVPGGPGASAAPARPPEGGVP